MDVLHLFVARLFSAVQTCVPLMAGTGPSGSGLVSWPFEGPRHGRAQGAHSEPNRQGKPWLPWGSTGLVDE